MPTNGQLLARIDERTQTIQADVGEIKKVVGEDHDALLRLAGKHETDVAHLKGQIKATNIWQGVATAIGTAIGSVFGFANKP